MRYVRFSADGDGPRSGVRADGNVYDLTEAVGDGPDPFASLLQQADGDVDDLCSRASREYGVEEVSLLAPLATGGRLFCLGGVYASHLEERGRDLWTVPEQWYVPRSAVVGPGEPIKLRERNAENVKPAAELGVVIGQGGRYISETEALEHIAGFTVSNDITARTDWPGPRGYKIMDSFNPIGPSVTPADAVENPLDLGIEIRQDEETICTGSTRGHRFTLSFIISYMSTLVELRPGDVLSTGDPGGVEDRLRPGNSVDLDIESLDTLRNPVEIE